jgi:hypothetical protein
MCLRPPAPPQKEHVLSCLSLKPWNILCVVQELSLQHISNGVTGRSLLSMENLTVLDISWTRDIASDAIEQLAPRLKRLTMRGIRSAHSKE